MKKPKKLGRLGDVDGGAYVTGECGMTIKKPSEVELVAMAMYIGPNVNDLNIPNKILNWKIDRSCVRAAYRADAKRILRALRGGR